MLNNIKNIFPTTGHMLALTYVLWAVVGCVLVIASKNLLAQII
jgi:hypothetical protein